MIALVDYLHLLFIIPALIYIGICIITDKQNKSLGILFMTVFILLIILHTAKIIKIYQRNVQKVSHQINFLKLLLFLRYAK